MRSIALTCVLAAVIGCSRFQGIASQRTIEGRIAALDRSGGVVRLVDGTVISVPPDISTVPLEPGQEVTIAYYLEPSGKRVMTAVWVDSSPNESGM